MRQEIEIAATARYFAPKVASVRSMADVELAAYRYHLAEVEQVGRRVLRVSAIRREIRTGMIRHETARNHA